jgi:methyl-accepting chemotaxis protein
VSSSLHTSIRTYPSASILSTLIHETQKERGASAGFTGSKGKKFVVILPQQRKLTDQRRKALSTYLVDFDPTQYGVQLEQRLADLLGDLKQLDSIRIQISELSLPVSRVVGWYTAVNAKLLAVVEQMPHVVSDARLVTRISAYVNYLQSKERAGIERAVLSATFGQGHFAPGMYKRSIELVTAQNELLRVFSTMAITSDQQFYEESMQHESVAEVERMRQIAFEKANVGDFGVDAEEWFSTITQKINQLKKVDDHLAAGILQQTDKHLVAATSLMQLYYAVIAGLLLITGLIVYQVGASIRNSVRAMSNLVKQVATEGDFSVRATASSQDAIGEMSLAINELLESLQTSIQGTNGVVDDVAHGIFSSRVTADLKGDLAVLKRGVNHSADSVEKTMSVLAAVMQQLSSGNFSYRAERVDMDGGFGEVLTGAMESMESLDQIVGDINQVMDAVAQGDFDVRVTVGAQGDLGRLKSNLNQSFDTLGEALSEVVTVSNKMGEGDLSHQVSGDYQGSLGILKDSVNTTRINFSEIVSKVRSAAEKVHGSSVKISQGSDELSTRTSEQAANLEQTSSSMEEIASTVNMNSESASQANRLSAEALQHAQNGGQVAAEAVTAMLGINASSAQIAEIITLIDGIAFQTNLLALNAAVEAARAGEQGQGFAVVAGEVRALAQRSASAAKDIKELIQDSGNRIEQGSDLVSSSGVALNSIVKSVEKMTSISSEIESATKEQTLGINQVNSAVTQLDSVTQQNMSLVEETAAACSQLKYEADELANMVSVFKLKA